MKIDPPEQLNNVFPLTVLLMLLCSIMPATEQFTTVLF